MIATVLLMVAIFFFIRRAGKDSYVPRGIEPEKAELVYTKHARCRMDCRHITEAEVDQVLHEGKVNESKSDPLSKPNRRFAYEGTTGDGQHVRLIVTVDKGKVVVITVIDLGKEWPCNCN